MADSSPLSRRRARADRPEAAERAAPPAPAEPALRELGRRARPEAMLALQRAAGNRAARLAIARIEGDEDEGGEKLDDRAPVREAIERDINEIKDAIAEVEAVYLPVYPSIQYLGNRFEHLKEEFVALIRRYESGRSSLSMRGLQRLRSSINHVDRLPLLRTTLEQLRKRSVLRERLMAIFAQARPVRFAEIRSTIERAPESQKKEAAADDDLIEAASRWMAPPGHLIPDDPVIWNDYPDFVLSLGVKQSGTVAHMDEGVVDNAIRTTLAAWVQQRVADQITIPGHVTILKSGNFKKAQEKFQASLPGGGKVNAFTEGGNIYLGASAGEDTTIVHEGIHLYAQGSFRGQLGDDFDEGVTEYFARKVVTAMGVTRGDKYKDQHDVAKVIISVLTDDATAVAYFSGNLDPIRGQYREARLKHDSEATDDWDAFRELLKDKKYEEAKKLIV